MMYLMLVLPLWFTQGDKPAGGKPGDKAPPSPPAAKSEEPPPEKLEFSTSDPEKALLWCKLLAEPGVNLNENALAKKNFLDDLHRKYSGNNGKTILWPLRVDGVTDKVVKPQPIKLDAFSLQLALVDDKGKKQEMVHKNLPWVAELKKDDWFFIQGTITSMTQKGAVTTITLKKWQLVPAKKE